MSQRWAQIQLLPAEALLELRTVYADVFPIEIRDHLSSWIEEQPWSQFNEDTQSDINYALTLLEELLQQIQRKARLLPHLKEVAHQIEDKYISDPLCFIRDMKSCINCEELLISRSQKSPAASSSPDDNTELAIVKVAKEFESLNYLNMTSESVLTMLQDKYQQFEILLQKLPLINDKLKSDNEDLAKRRAVVENIKTDDLEPEYFSEILELQQKGEELRSQQEYITNNLPFFIREILDLGTKVANTLQQAHIELELVKRKLLDEDLPIWKHKQQLACNGEPLDNLCIQYIQKRCECLENLIIKCLQQTLKFKEIHQKTIQYYDVLSRSDSYAECIQRLQQSLPIMLIELITRTFIVDKQPPQVLRKDTKFEAGVSVLVGNAINMVTCLPKVTVSIINKKQARKMVEGQEIAEKRTCGSVKNNQATVELLKSGRLSAKFSNLVIQKVERDTKRSGKKVAEEKFCLVFETNIRIGEYELPTPLRVLSVPVIITSHVSQDCDSLATIMWDHQFSTPNRTPFKVPVTVPWQSMANLLSVKFQHETGHGLTDEHLNYIASKIYGKTGDYSDKVISINMFSKEKILEGNFTFWEWFYHLMRLTTDHLQGLWKEGHIAGFISKSEIERCLTNTENGTFVCRFSDSKLGGVSIAHRKRTNGVCHTEPFISKDLNISSLSNLILDHKKWTYLYPSKPKETVFGKYAKTENDVQMNEGQSRYETFIWTIKKISGDDDDDFDSSDQDCYQALMELIDGTNDSQIANLAEEGSIDMMT